MTIYEELKELEEDAEREKRNSTYTLAEREYYAGMAQAYREERELFDKRERPKKFALYDKHMKCDQSVYYPEDVSDFLPPEAE